MIEKLWEISHHKSDLNLNRKSLIGKISKKNPSSNIPTCDVNTLNFTLQFPQFSTLSLSLEASNNFLIRFFIRFDDFCVVSDIFLEQQNAFTIKTGTRQWNEDDGEWKEKSWESSCLENIPLSLLCVYFLLSNFIKIFSLSLENDSESVNLDTQIAL